MTNQARDGRTVDPRSLKKLELISFVSLVAVAIAGILLLSLTGTAIATAVNIVAWIFIPVAAVFNIWLRKQKRRNSSMSFEDVLNRIDPDAVRSVKANKGEVSAVKELRRQEPRLSLKDAVDLVKQL
ncbi:hypothetical protein K378_03682 [Streptomyces sp. Amel2xB2]|uniref:hypothetical protein n=1 Tax=Streptomyces sp. Amel2xB2 TaxID=1305829 RepID=UPI000DB9CD37|nr:hypothetical protein [Streptomyces sp. Amel2xB2]RAJ63567.1 hypothetical protein K378_03682 [Streptomyces sp. Amel2xB2]